MFTPINSNEEIERDFLIQFRTLTKMGLNVKEGQDDEEKFLTSRLVDATKQAHGVPFSPGKQYAKNVLKNVKCSECKKSRVLYAAKMLKSNNQNRLEKRAILRGTSFADMYKNPVAYAREKRG